jgi:nucleotide-binding universal stress UspA family protein
MAINTLLLALAEREDTGTIVETAIDIADPDETTVVVGTLYEDETHASVGKDLNISSPNELAERDSDVEAVVSRLEEASIETEIRGSIGTGGQPYVEMAEQFGADMVVLQGMSRSPTGKAVFGSVPQEIMLNAPCPVTFIRR